MINVNVSVKIIACAYYCNYCKIIVEILAHVFANVLLIIQ